MHSERPRTPFRGQLIPRDPDEEETEVDPSCRPRPRNRPSTISVVNNPVPKLVPRLPSLWDSTPPLPAIIPIPIEYVARTFVGRRRPPPPKEKGPPANDTIDEREPPPELKSDPLPKVPTPERPTPPAPLPIPVFPKQRASLLRLAFFTAVLTAIGTVAIHFVVGSEREPVVPAVLAPVAPELAAEIASRMRTDAILYRTVDANTERRRRIDGYVASLAASGEAIVPHSDAALVRAIMATRLERASLAEDVDRIIDQSKADEAVGPAQPVPRAKRHLVRAIAFHQTKQPKEARIEIEAALDAVHGEAPFVIDMADDLLEAAGPDAARIVIDMPSWPWSHPGATIVECRLAIAAGDLERAQRLINDLRASGRLDAETLRRFDHKSCIDNGTHCQRA